MAGRDAIVLDHWMQLAAPDQGGGHVPAPRRPQLGQYAAAHGSIRRRVWALTRSMSHAGDIITDAVGVMRYGHPRRAESVRTWTLKRTAAPPLDRSEQDAPPTVRVAARQTFMYVHFKALLGAERRPTSRHPSEVDRWRPKRVVASRRALLCIACGRHGRRRLYLRLQFLRGVEAAGFTEITAIHRSHSPVAFRHSKCRASARECDIRTGFKTHVLALTRPLATIRVYDQGLPRPQL